MTTDRHVDQPLLDPRDAFMELGRLSFDTTSMEAMLQRVAESAMPGREALFGGLDLHAVAAYAFGDTRVRAITFASDAAVAVQNMHLYETTGDLDDNLDIAMRTRAVNAQAGGIVMSKRGCDETIDLRLRGGPRPWLKISP